MIGGFCMKTLKVFLASTYKDLKEYREKVEYVLKGCEALYKGMEYFGASYEKPLDACNQRIDDSDLVICLIGASYGSNPPNKNKSFTELEIEYSLKIGKPINTYILDLDKCPVLIEHADFGEKAERLKDFKKEMMEKMTCDCFTSPDDLAIKIMRDLFKFKQPTLHELKNVKTVTSKYRECLYDLIAEFYDDWYEGHWQSDQPFFTISSIVGPYFESNRGNFQGIRILDCACGTGNTFVTFSRNNYNIYGTDGSQEMLNKAKKNCEMIGISINNLILKPINWTDYKGYLEHFKENYFDLIINTANSFCHIPPTKEYMQTALNNFYKLLKPGGLLLIDTKRYICSDPINNVPTYKELRYDANIGDWIERYERIETRKIDHKGIVKYHTRLMYDTDPSFSKEVRRALIILTIYGEKFSPRTLVIPYYPLPSIELKKEMEKANFETKIHYAMKEFAINWKYDIVVGKKQ
jgi:SAM-dependent methyltransferase